MRALIGAVVLAGLVGSAPACDDDEIEFVAIDGSVIKMRSGATFHVISSVSSTRRCGSRLTTS